MKRDFSLIPSILLVVFLVAAAIFVATRPPRERERIYDPDSASPTGTLALLLWLDEMGYEVTRTTKQLHLESLEDIDLLLIFPGAESYTTLHAFKLRQWVENGGTLLLVGPSWNQFELERTFGVDSRRYTTPVTALHQAQPLLPDHAARWVYFGNTDRLWLRDAPTAIPVVHTGRGEADPDEIVVAVQAVGQGVIWHFMRGYDFTNQFLEDPHNAQLLLPVLRTVPAGGRVVFDAYHFFGSPESEGRNLEANPEGINSVIEWLFATPGGWATVAAFAIVWFYFLFQGRRLGPPLPVVTGERRREAAEFVEAMAGLYRRSRQQEMVARHHKHRLKAGLGRALRISATLPDDEFMRRLERTDHRLSESELAEVAALLKTLSAAPNDDTLVAAVERIDHILRR